jgi:hypothetical protein
LEGARKLLEQFGRKTWLGTFLKKKKGKKNDVADAVAELQKAREKKKNQKEEKCSFPFLKLCILEGVGVCPTQQPH